MLAIGLLNVEIKVLLIHMVYGATIWIESVIMAKKCSECQQERSTQHVRIRFKTKHKGEFKNLFLYTFFGFFCSFFKCLLLFNKGGWGQRERSLYFYKNVPHSFHFCFVLHAHWFPLSALDTMCPCPLKLKIKGKSKTKK